MSVQGAVVVEVFHYTPARIVVTGRCKCCGDYLFLLLPATPMINFGDFIEVGRTNDTIGLHIYRGNSRLRYRLHPLDMPDELLVDLVEARK